MPGLSLAWSHLRGKLLDSFTSRVFNNKVGEVIGLKLAILVGVRHSCESFED